MPMPRPPISRMVFAANFKAARKAAKLRQSDIHKTTGLSASFISDVENAKANISLDKADLLARVVGQDLHRLLDPNPPVRR
jgi:transcriptional regulator with XRE-family HTH domain